MIFRRTAMFSILCLLLSGVTFGGHAAAQGAESPAPEPGAEAAVAAPSLPSGAAFMKPLGRLSSILGSVHFLRKLCGAEDADIWRTRMNDLLEAQAPGEADRKSLVAAFNGGYRAFESTYRKCTPAARLAVSRYQEEGAVLSREIGARYGN